MCAGGFSLDKGESHRIRYLYLKLSALISAFMAEGLALNLKNLSLDLQANFGLFER